MHKLEKIAGGIVLVLLVPYLAAAFHYSVVELEGPILNVFVPVILVLAFTSVLVGRAYKLPFLQSTRVGVLMGLIVSLSVFLSNLLVYELSDEEFTVKEVRIGKGSSVNWLVSTESREDVLLNLRIKGVTTSTPPSNVALQLNRGWLGYYFGNEA